MKLFFAFGNKELNKKNLKETLFSFMAESKNEYQEGKNKFYWLSLKKLNFDQSELL
jgi:hypothetical protein